MIVQMSMQLLLAHVPTQSHGSVQVVCSIFFSGQSGPKNHRDVFRIACNSCVSD